MIGDGAVDHIVDNIDHSIGMVILVMAPMSLLFIILIMMLVWTGLETTNINNIASNNKTGGIIVFDFKYITYI